MSENYNITSSAHSNNLLNASKSVQKLDAFMNVTLACDDGETKANKFILFSGSDFFQDILSRIRHPDPYIYLKHTKLQDLQAVLKFMHDGEVTVQQNMVDSLLEIAQELRVKGLNLSESKRGENPQNDESLILPDPYSILEEELVISEDNVIKSTPTSDGKKTSRRLADENAMVDNLNSLSGMSEGGDVDEKALDMMEKKIIDKKIHWTCKFCNKTNNDKTRIRKHVITNHIRKLEKVLDDTSVDIDIKEESIKNGESMFMQNISMDSSYNMSDEDLRALSMMKSSKDEHGKKVWICNICDKESDDKTRIRKHVKVNHLKPLKSLMQHL